METLKSRFSRPVSSELHDSKHIIYLLKILSNAVISFTVPMLVMAIGGMQYYSNATLWNRLSQLLYASDEISKGLYAEVLPLGSVRKSFFGEPAE
jgi:hypothetical protein